MTDVVLKAEHLTKRFGTLVALDDVSFTVNRGEVFGFLGPNGAGKTTVIRIITGLITPDVGQVTIMGHSIQTEFTQAIRNVGAIVEIPVSYGYLSGRENLEICAALAGEVSPARIDEVLEIVGLSQRANDKVSGYSLGMKQRLGIAQALLAEPELLILDEPTSGLDPQGMREIRELITVLAKMEETTIFLSSHLLHEVERICNRVAIINKGKLVAIGSIPDLLAMREHQTDFEELFLELTGGFKDYEIIQG